MSVTLPPPLPSAGRCDEFSLSVICRNYRVLWQPSAASLMNVEHFTVCVRDICAALYLAISVWSCVHACVSAHVCA